MRQSEKSAKMKSQKKEAKVTALEITQQFKSQFFDGYDVDEIKIIEQADVEKIAILFLNRLTNANFEVIEMYIIKHDRDNFFDDEGNIVGKTNHFHCLIKFVLKQGPTLTEASQILGIERNFIETPARGKYGYINKLAYLMHAKETEKYPYDASDVKTIRGKSYEKIYHENKDIWERGKKVKKMQEVKKTYELDAILMDILTGDLKKSQLLLDNELYLLYAKNKREIDEAFNTLGERKMAVSTQLLEQGKFKLSVYFITGSSGNGKSTYAKEFMSALKSKAKEQLGENWDVYNGATSNVLDGYRGEEIIFLDDLRGSAMGASDWLQLLDNYNASPASARYKNKDSVASRAIVITSSVEPLEFFYYTKNKGTASEAMDQFIRRLTACVTVLPYEEAQSTDMRYKIATPQKVPQYSTGVSAMDTFAMTYDLIEDINLYNQEGSIRLLINEVINSHDESLRK